MQQKNPIQWFPGHMAKTRRMMAECLPNVDLVIELLDARIPKSSKNPEIQTILKDMPTVIALTKSVMADPTISRRWIEYYRNMGRTCILIDSHSGQGLPDLSDGIRAVMNEKLERYKEKGMEGRRLKAMIVGIPNVGKSSLINRLAGSKKAKVEDRPGVTLNKQWIPTSIGLDLLDMPGVLWPKFEDATVGENLALTGAIRDQILDIEEMAMILCRRLVDVAPKAFCERYRLSYEQIVDLDGYDIFEAVGRKRGFLISGGEVNAERTATMLLDEFRGGVIGRISLEMPEEENANANV
jgi:ribosome biogenesis GTPase A